MLRRKQVVVDSTTVTYVDTPGYEQRVRLVDVHGPDPLHALRTHLAGRDLLAPVDLARTLIAHGAELRRHAHEMRRDLTTSPPPADWAREHPAPPRHVVPCDRDATALLPAWQRAFPPGHPDGADGDDQRALTDVLRPLLSGVVLGTVLDSSALVVDARDDVIAGIVINDRGGLPWVGELFRDPDHPGLGGLLLRRALAHLAADGHPQAGLAVTAGNPAQRLYERLGFTVVDTTMTLAVP
ncbi:GNAT family N-acetyltransferase [Saccharopolyspora cebuensis]|uniref:GNAT family N-acetyltransferase n=1 Tax=Saccharopolyspora cebuensis TaxID=418759 RepID=UPI0031EF1C5F